jgi:hypothetical protein
MRRTWLKYFPHAGSPREIRPEDRARFRNPQFVSFMAQNNRRRVDPNLYDAVLRGRKMVKTLLRFALAGGCAWVVLESAKALSIF